MGVGSNRFYALFWRPNDVDERVEEERTRQMSKGLSTSAPSSNSRWKRKNVRTLSWRARSTFCTLPRHDLVDVALVQEGGGVAAAVAAPVPVVAALVAVTAAGATSVAANAHAISPKTQIRFWEDFLDFLSSQSHAHCLVLPQPHSCAE